MTDEQRRVQTVHPTAFCCYDSDKGKHKVYYLEGQCRVALSNSWDTASMAWHEAARAVEKKHGTTAE